MSRQTRVGLVVLTGALLFLLGLFAIANRSFLFTNTFFVKSQYNRVAGLQVGSEVQYQGITVGRVEQVQLPNRPGGKITVTMAIRENARHLIHQNTQAQIKSDGLVGNQIVVLVSAPGEAEPVSPDDFIPGVDPFDLFQITDKALASVQKFEQAAQTFDQLMQKVNRGEGTLGKIVTDETLYNEFVETTNETRRVLNNLADNAEALVGLAGEATQGVESILAKVDEGEGTVAKLINDPAVFNSILAVTDTLQSVASGLRSITTNAENTTNWGVLGAYRFAELMEAAKHNWLFKRYFEERGYQEPANFEVREQALLETSRQLTLQQQQLQQWEERLRAREAALGITAAAKGTDGTTSESGNQ